MASLINDLGKERVGRINRAMLIEYGRKHAKKGAGPVTLGIEIGIIKMIITHAAALHGLDISPEPVDLARIGLKRLGLIGKGTERDRRQTRTERNRLFRCFDENERLTLLATQMAHSVSRQASIVAEICHYRPNHRKSAASTPPKQLPDLHFDRK